MCRPPENKSKKLGQRHKHSMVCSDHKIFVSGRQYTILLGRSMEICYVNVSP